jgi:hypothetical protein
MTTPAIGAPTRTLRMVFHLGRIEARHVLAGFGLACLVATWLVMGPVGGDAWDTYGAYLYAGSLIAALGAVLVLNLAATRETRSRAAELLDAAPGTAAVRAAGLLVAVLAPPLALLIVAVALNPLVALATGHRLSDPEVSLFFGEGPAGWLLLPKLAAAVMLGGLLGVVLGMWLPYFWIAVLVVPGLFLPGLAFGPYGGGGRLAWLSPLADRSAIVGQHRYACEVDRICQPAPWPLGDATPYAHLIYVAALCGVLAALALLRRSRSRGVLLFGAGSVTVAIALGLALVP